ncbi:hypothetical protein TRFO_27129 [Tritrichomonas foetus]|uniref:Uncharacterized protein n=1 Tax=Tritrichomonas foetus TaxID=1144522 RepID=A0A1J4K1T1_9EUKA|nr:hypothetical protein TRFO_27129 [Tritrichomonas foetus]|eukprot:OHT05195.1 hypothetical protein TRFO_27129 [Tritrichomonas foetus]
MFLVEMILKKSIYNEFYPIEFDSTNFPMFTKRPATAFTINARDPVPDPPGRKIPREIRPPPKVYYPYRDCNGISPKKIERMMKKKKEYEEELARIQTENDIAKFEARQKGTYVESVEPSVPKIPLPPSIDFDVIRSFEPPSATRFYDYTCPNIRPKTAPKTIVNGNNFNGNNSNRSKTNRSNKTTERQMARGCPCCNPDHLSELKAPKLTATRNGRPIQRPTTATARKKSNLPRQMNQAYWNVLDEPSVPAKPKNKFIEYQKPSQFSMLRTGPRPGGIPICVNDLIACREAGEEWFENEMAKKKDHELMQREKTLHERSTYSRNFNCTLKEHTTEIAIQSKQKWALNGGISNLGTHFETKKPKLPSKEELEALEELSKYDEKLYQDYQAKKRPTDEMELLLQQSGMRKYT